MQVEKHITSNSICPFLLIEEYPLLAHTPQPTTPQDEPEDGAEKEKPPVKQPYR